MSLLDIIKADIIKKGPMPFAQFMNLCLLHPKWGYYQQETVFGQDGDFITAPDISQMFGEMIALFLIDRWVAMGQPNRFLMVELGAGRGQLMQDIVRTARIAPDFLKAMQICFIEQGEKRIKEQKSRFPSARFFNEITDLPEEGPVLFLANEFFDALPVHAFLYQDQKWQERAVDIENGDLVESLMPAGSALSKLPETLLPPETGAQIEICMKGQQYAQYIRDVLARQQGCGLIIDYGYKISQYGDSLQAIKKHKYQNLLDCPGQQDITAHVDFQALSKVMTHKSLDVFAPLEQGVFLTRLGIEVRAQKLLHHQQDDKKAVILADLKRLIDPSEMGALFKVLCVQSRHLSAPPAFDG